MLIQIVFDEPNQPIIPFKGEITKDDIYIGK